MARRKRNTNKSTLSVHEDEVNSRYSKINDRTHTIQTDRNSSKADLLRAEIREKRQNIMQKLDAQLEIELTNLNMRFVTFMCGLPKSILNMKVKLIDELLLNLFGNILETNKEPTSLDNSDKPTTVRGRRSRSATGANRKGVVKKIGNSKRRSSSLDMFKTPVNKVSLGVFTTAKKYTVSKTVKKVEDSGISFKRIMKPNEEAISTTGSPLFVHPSATAVSAPIVNIPLPGGVVMNIEPKKPKGQYSIPELDETTKAQLRTLCQQMSNML
ncbi:UNVERIFIED_CONTAM: hypothetical protein PYX00_005502 [Menopon gallinae]|uniref:Borealin C-terminal domain-containing protein n=1 Tax=Menopon gallinae TaxID=328185 RepID=A0AAW2HTA5_9NEOP